MDIKKNIYITFFLIYFFALAIRIWGINEVGVYPDEVTWMVKGKESIYALFKGNLNYFRNAWWNNSKDTYAISWPLVILNGSSHILFAGEGKYSLHFFSDITASRIPVILVVSLLSPLIFYFGIQFIGFWPAVLAGLMYAINPISIGLDRWLLNDSLLALFCFLGIAGFLKKSYWSGLWLALAFLTKPNGLLIGTAWLTFYLFNFKDKEIRKLFWFNCLSALFFIFLLWPQSWIRPIISIPEYLAKQIVLANVGDPIHNYYLGEATISPNWTYYIFQILFRTPVTILVGLLGSMVFFFRKKPTHSFIAILIFLIINLFLMSTTSIKGGVRYILFVYPWLYLVSSSFYFRIFKKFSFLLLLPLVLVLFRYPPNFYLYYNQFIGGPVNAVKYDLVGLCIGNKSALNYLDANKIEGTVAVVGCADAAPYHTNRTLTKNYKLANYIILESAYIQQFPNNPEVLDIKLMPVFKKIYDNGVLTATIIKP